MSKTIRILICDDDPIVHQSLSLYLDNEDFLHDSAYDGKQALDMIKKEHYDLMLLDQMMPGMTGMEVCQAVRKDSQLPIIMLTARGGGSTAFWGLKWARTITSSSRSARARSSPHQGRSAPHLRRAGYRAG